jgi:prepilin-type N-terminal cleavage/methylation domain-containing protein
MVEVMGVSLKTDNEEWSGKIPQIRGSEGGRRNFSGTSMHCLRWRFPGSPPPASPIAQSALRAQRHLRFSVLRETPVTFAWDHFKKLTCCGFTLFEVAVVLFIISLFFVLVTVPIEGVLSGGDLGQATRMLMSEVSNLRGEAAYTRKIQTLVLNIEQNTYYALEPETLVEFKKTEESLFEEAKEVVPRKKDLPPGVFFADVVLDTLGKVQEGKAEVRFFANGCVEHALIHLKNEAGKFYTLEINPVTGLIRTYEGYIEQKRQGSRFHTS